MTELTRVTQAYLDVPQSPQIARVTQAFFDIPGIGASLLIGRKTLARWRSRVRHRDDLEYLPITSQRDLLRRVRDALDALDGSPSTAIRTRAQQVREGLLGADTIERRSLLRIDFQEVIDHLEEVLWALNAHEKQRQHRMRDDDELMLILHAARERGYYL